ncbi:hypothetical protein [Bacillus sp. Marseille-P3661]|uniref:hypothetical protein n=1 Tax=Bacillus sp. Marseille-P3661 TaxID=1936234 RepID=UPI000C864C58|nr:hypothetical protein [Bacillus sp. Marseille-P3661]
MLVEINLLGKPEKRNLAPFVIFTSLAILIVSLSILAFMLYKTTESELTRLERELQSKQQLLSVYEQKKGTESATTAVDDLIATIEWVETFPTPTVLLIQHLTSLLPERGFIMNFSYSDDGSLGLQVQTDTNREMAYYLKSLLDSPYISEASLNSLSTIPIVVEGEEGSGTFEGNNYVPRYTGQFQLTVNKDALRAEVEAEGES